MIEVKSTFRDLVAFAVREMGIERRIRDNPERRVRWSSVKVFEGVEENSDKVFIIIDRAFEDENSDGVTVYETVVAPICTSDFSGKGCKGIYEIIASVIDRAIKGVWTKAKAFEIKRIGELAGGSSS